MKVKLEDWLEEGRAAVIEALDSFVGEQLEGGIIDHHGVSLPSLTEGVYAGANDEDLPELFKAVDTQLRKVAARINDKESPIRGSHYLKIVEE